MPGEQEANLWPRPISVVCQFPTTWLKGWNTILYTKRSFSDLYNSNSSGGQSRTWPALSRGHQFLSPITSVRPHWYYYQETAAWSNAIINFHYVLRLRVRCIRNGGRRTAVA